jgi:hypothetical protein
MRAEKSKKCVSRAGKALEKPLGGDSRGLIFDLGA